MNECFSKYFILNGSPVPSENFENSLVYEGESVYEVLRAMNGAPVFFDDHMDRLEQSVRNTGKSPLADRNALKRDIQLLYRSDKKREVNLKIVFNYNNEVSNYLVYNIEPIYPTAEQYREGVKGVLCHAERSDPESKVINHKLRTTIYHKLIVEGAYEALLVNNDGLITEGSRSNIFFARDNVLYTAPDELVLGGITRKHLLRICSDLKIPVRFECVKASGYDRFETAFMTGTSPVVLPFNMIDKTPLRVDHPLVKKLRDMYFEKMDSSIREFRK